jgi:hypothetical protein
MKYTLTLLLACTPLVALTTWTFVELGLPAAETPPPPVAVDLPATAKLADEAAGCAESQAALVAQLVQTDLLDTHAPELAQVTSDRLKPIAERWKQSTQARALLVKYQAVHAPQVDPAAKPAERERQATLALAALEHFIATEKAGVLGEITGADGFFNLLGHRVDRLKAEISTYDVQYRIVEALGKATDEVNAGKAQACLARLDKEPLSLARDSETKARLQTLRQRAEFRLAADRLQGRPAASPADRELFHAFDDFFRRFPEPPSEAERHQHAELERRRDRLRLDIAIADLSQPADLETLLTQAAQIVGNSTVDEASRERVRARVLEWLVSTGFPRQKYPDSLLGKQEAQTKNGQRKIGKFLLPKGAEQWRFWTDKRHQAERPRGDEQISREGLVAPPATPMYVGWAQEYNDLSEKLARRGGSEDEWRAFARRCDEIDDELVEYREHWGVDEEPDKSCRDWSFRDRAATARQIVEHWRQFEMVLQKAPGT